MATDFAAAPSAMPTTAYQQQLYHPSMTFTPLHSGASTPATISPTSPRTATTLAQLHTRQIRPPKTPLSVPAALRPTEKPVRHSPPKSGHARFDSADTLGNARSRPTTGDSFGSGLSRAASDEWSENLLGEVTGPPTRNHWKPDSSTPTCSSPTCSKPFTLFSRRHHCRRCGSIYCGEHSPFLVPLDQHARFHPRGPRVRACELCWADYRAWEMARVSRSNSEASQDGNNGGGTGNVVVGGGGGSGGGMAHRGILEGVEAQRGASFVGSVPRDWNWSTF